MAKEDTTIANNNGNGSGEIMLFGFRVVVDSMRKSVSLNNLSQYEHRLDSSSSSNDPVVPPPLSGGACGGGSGSGGYASADDAVVVHRSSVGAPIRERKRGVPWTEEEHKLFLIGLQKVGKGDWRGISRNFVKTRTPTQVASHAQKYFLRRSNLKSKGRRRSSLFDITTTDTVTVNQTNDNHQQQQINKNIGAQSPQPQHQREVYDSNVRFSVTQQETSGFFSYPTTTSYNNGVNVEDHEMKIVSTSNNNKSSMEMFDLNLSLSMASSSSSDLRHASSFHVVQARG